MNESEQSMTCRKAIQLSSKPGSVVGLGQIQTMPVYGLGGDRRRGCMILFQALMWNVGTYRFNVKERETVQYSFASTNVNRRGGAIRSSVEASVMGVERRGLRYSAILDRQPAIGRSDLKMAKSIDITKQEIWHAYKAVRANKGSAGFDGQTIVDFDKNLKNNLYKIWNRLVSGSYFPPPVKRVNIPKSNGKSRPLGIPTFPDRIAQMVIKNRLEPIVEPVFHHDSYGYRPGKSAIQAIAKARERCWRDDWVLDMDIKGFFDELDHRLVLLAVSRFTQCKWILMYIERWLKASVVLPDGSVLERMKGTPQGGVISPLIANIYLHLVFDQWMLEKFPCVHFERYADDIVVHCRSHKQLEYVEREIRTRFARCKLELCHEKTKIVYCKDDRRPFDFPTQSFDFLGYTFRPRSSRYEHGRLFTNFSPAVSRKSLKSMRSKIKAHPIVNSIYSAEITEVAVALNPMIQGWINYYGCFGKSSMSSIYSYIADFIKLQRLLPSLLDRITYYLYAQRLSLVGAYVVTL